MKTVRTLFNPMRIEIDGVEAPIHEQSYLNENGAEQKVLYAIVNGQKHPIQFKHDVWDGFEKDGINFTIQKVESARLKKIEDSKKHQEGKL